MLTCHMVSYRLLLLAGRETERISAWQGNALNTLNIERHTMTKSPFTPKFIEFAETFELEAAAYEAQQLEISDAHHDMETMAKALDMAREADHGEAEDYYQEHLHLATCYYEDVANTKITHPITAMDFYHDAAAADYKRVFGSVPTAPVQTVKNESKNESKPRRVVTIGYALSTAMPLFTSVPAFASDGSAPSNSYGVAAIAFVLGVVCHMVYTSFMQQRTEHLAKLAKGRAEAALHSTPEYKMEQQRLKEVQAQTAVIDREIDRIDGKIKNRKDFINDAKMMIEMGVDGNRNQLYSVQIDRYTNELAFFNDKVAGLKAKKVDLARKPEAVKQEAKDTVREIMDFVRAHNMYCTPDFENKVVQIRIEYASENGSGYDMIEVDSMKQARLEMGY